MTLKFNDYSIGYVLGFLRGHFSFAEIIKYENNIILAFLKREYIEF